jgi:hypothetical protein
MKGVSGGMGMVTSIISDVDTLRSKSRQYLTSSYAKFL